jgi:RimJ/RimL family protein N-acetyltransferase
MKFIVETERLILREMTQDDAEPFFEMDSNPEVHTYLGNNPLKDIQQTRDVIEFVRKQYVDNGIGRWTLIEKASGEYVGWGGLKLIKEETKNHVNYLDVGYRLTPKHWKKGYATESAIASVKYGFEKLEADCIYAVAHKENKASRHALEKTGLVYTDDYFWEGIACDWFEISFEEWKEKHANKTNKILLF